MPCTKQQHTLPIFLKWLLKYPLKQEHFQEKKNALKKKTGSGMERNYCFSFPDDEQSHWQTDCAFVLHSSICVEHVMLDWSSTMLLQLLRIAVVLTMVWAPLSKISPFTYRDSCNLPSRRRNFLYHHTSGKEMKCIFSASTSEGSSINPNPKPHKDRKLCTAAQHTHAHTHSLDITWSANKQLTLPWIPLNNISAINVVPSTCWKVKGWHKVLYWLLPLFN